MRVFLRLRIHTGYFCHSMLVEAVGKACPDLRGGNTVETVLNEELAKLLRSNVTTVVVKHSPLRPKRAY